jgi:hypothetical protein
VHGGVPSAGHNKLSGGSEASAGIGALTFVRACQWTPTLCLTLPAGAGIAARTTGMRTVKAVP